MRTLAQGIHTYVHRHKNAQTHLVPHFVPQDGHADKLVADKLCLLHQRRAVLPNLVQHLQGSSSSSSSMAGERKGGREALGGAGA